MQPSPAVKRALLVVGASLLLLPFQNCGDGFKSNSSEMNSDTSAGANATTLPMAPSQLSASSPSAAEVDLHWIDNSDNESGFRIERAQVSVSPFVTNTGPFQVVQSVGDGVTAYKDTGVMPATQYIYRVVAFNSLGSSDYSGQYTVNTSSAPTTAPAAPSNLAATAYSATQINLSWNDNSANEYGFKVERSSNGGTTFTQIVLVTANQATYSDINLNPSTAYQYRVRSTNPVGDSAYTAVAMATTQAAVNTSSFAYLNTNVFQTNCVSCHTTGNTSGGVNLSTYQNILGNVVAGNSGNSRVYTAVASHQMPPGAPLSDATVAAIKAWIDGGAQNN